MNETVIPTSFGSIRHYRPGDATSLVKYANNRAVSVNLRDGFPYPYTRDSARAFLDMVSRQRPVTFFAIATETEAIGGIGIVLGADVHRRTAEMGYWLGEPFWGRGIGTEAVRVFTEFAFERFDLVRVYAQPYARNTGSVRVLEKAGFVAEGLMRANVIKDGVILDQWLFAKVRDGAAGA